MTKINIRELSRNTKAISERAKAGEYFKVYKNKEFMFSIVPEDVDIPHKSNMPAGQSLFEVFKGYRFNSGELDLSKQVDKLVYEESD